MNRDAHPAGNEQRTADSGSEIATRAVTVTFFPDAFALTLGKEDLTLRQLADRIARQTAASKDKLPLLKLARFGDKRTKKNCLRNNANTVEISGAEGDHDAETMPFDAAVAAMRQANVRSLLYTSPSHAT